MRGRKKNPVRDLREEKISPKEALKFLGLDFVENERFFYHLVREGFIRKSDIGKYKLGEVLQGFLIACAEKRFSIDIFLQKLSDLDFCGDVSENEFSNAEKKKNLLKQSKKI